MKDIATLGERAYARYVRMTNGRGHNGKKLPAWKDLGEELQEQWERGALQLGQAHTLIKEAVKERPSGGQRV